MANNYSAGTVSTNFDAAQSAVFLKESFMHEKLASGECETIEIAAAVYAEESEDGYCPDIFDTDGHGDFWNMENFDSEAAEAGILAVFQDFKDQGLAADMGVAFYCDKPRAGEFGGLSETYKQD